MKVTYGCKENPWKLNVYLLLTLYLKAFKIQERSSEVTHQTGADKTIQIYITNNAGKVLAKMSILVKLS